MATLVVVTTLVEISEMDLAAADTEEVVVTEVAVEGLEEDMAVVVEDSEVDTAEVEVSEVDTEAVVGVMEEVSAGVAVSEAADTILVVADLAEDSAVREQQIF